MRTARLAVWIASMVCVCLVHPEAVASGDLDRTFGEGGRVVTNMGYTFPFAESMLVQHDGRILVVGRYWTSGFDTWLGTFMARYLADGTLDSTFGQDGKVVVAPVFPGGSRAVGTAMALQPDGKIVLIGDSAQAPGRIFVQRYTSSGLPDTLFGDNGTAVIPRATESPWVALFTAVGKGIALQPDGKIVGVGWESLMSPYDDAIVVFRLNMDGSMDGTFGPAGTGITTITHGYASGADVFIRPGGKILVTGMLLNYSLGIRPTPLLARYNPDGSLDTSFGTSGTVTHRIHDADSSISGAALQPDGKIVTVGTASTDACRSFFARYETDGSPDTSFGTNGVSCLDSSFFGSPTTVLPGPGGTIVATGNAFDPATSGNGFAMVRLSSDGSLDPSFGAGGRSVVSILDPSGTSHASASCGAMQPDGRILVTGYFSGHPEIVVMRAHGRRRASPFERFREHENDVRISRDPVSPQPRTIGAATRRSTGSTSP